MADITGKAAAEAFIQKKMDEVRKARQRVERLEDALRHYEEVYNIITGVSSRDSSDVSREGTVQSGSQGEKVRKVLADAGEPVHIDEIMSRLGIENTVPAKNSLAGSLSRYVRQGQIFTRPARGTFGLVEWSNESEQEAESNITTQSALGHLLAERARESLQTDDESLL